MSDKAAAKCSNARTSANCGAVVIISSVQDFRLKRRGSIQAIAEELANNGADVTFVSLRFSLLSKRRSDPRMILARDANRLEMHDGVKCFLWWTVLHPFSTRHRLINTFLTPLFHLYGRYPNATLDTIIRQAATVVIESGLAIALLDRIRRLNPQATLIYRASDRLSTIDQHDVLGAMLRKHQCAIDAFCLLGPGMAIDFAWAFPKAFVVPPALNRDLVEADQTNPYEKSVNAVSLGAMLFDAAFFDLAAPLFPNVTFHIFGVSTLSNQIANVRYYADIPYAATWRYIRHADFGVAPYKFQLGAEYLADTSSKLMQYGAVGLPSVCPHFAVGRHSHRFGYNPGDAASITSAIERALSTPRQSASDYRGWSEIVPRLLSPRKFPDTFLGRCSAVEQPAPTLSLIVATRGRIEPLERLLSSLADQQFVSFEVIVVDQNETGVLDTLLRRYSHAMDLRHLRSPPGLSRARNVGLAASRGRIVGFPDDDCWYPAGRALEVVRFFDCYDSIDVLLGQTVDEDGIPSVNAVRGASELVSSKNVWFSGNSNTLFMRQPLAKTLLFDVGLGIGAASPFQSGEETDIILRGIQIGAKTVYCPNLTIHHSQVVTHIGRAQLGRAWRYSAGFGQVLRRHYSPLYPTYRIARSMAAAIFALARFRIDIFLYRTVWTAGTIRGFCSWRS